MNIVIRIGILILYLPTLYTKADGDWFRPPQNGSHNWEVHREQPKDRIHIRPAFHHVNRKKVLVLFHKKSLAYDIAIEQILTVFFENDLAADFELVNFYNDHEKGRALVDGLDKNRYDLIFSMGSKSTAFLLKYDQHAIPVVTVCSKDPVILGQVADYESGSGKNIAFTSLGIPIKTQLTYLKQLRRHLNQVAILYAEHNTSAVRTQVEPFIDAGHREGFKMYRIGVKHPSNARAELVEMMPDITAEMLTHDPTASKSIYWITGSTSVFREISVINRYAGPIPVLSGIPNVVREGDDSAVLSIGVSFENNARLAGLYAWRILSNQTTPAEMKVGVVSPPDIAINFKRATRVGLNIPFDFFELASFIYDRDGVPMRVRGKAIGN